MATRILNVSHLALRALEASIRQHVAAERCDDGTWDVLMSEALGHALTVRSEELVISVSDLIVSLHRRVSDNLDTLCTVQTAPREDV